MRKIEQQMVDAIRSHKDWKGSNTEVVVTYGDNINVFLHDILIAHVTDKEIQLFQTGWNTATTKSRLNAIIKSLTDGTKNSVYQLKYQWYCQTNGVDYPFEEVSSIPLTWLSN